MRATFPIAALLAIDLQQLTDEPGSLQLVQLTHREAEAIMRDLFHLGGINLVLFDQLFDE